MDAKMLKAIAKEQKAVLRERIAKQREVIAMRKKAFSDAAKEAKRLSKGKSYLITGYGYENAKDQLYFATQELKDLQDQLAVL
jgi:hypothetical protein